MHARCAHAFGFTAEIERFEAAHKIGAVRPNAQLHFAPDAVGAHNLADFQKFFFHIIYLLFQREFSV